MTGVSSMVHFLESDPFISDSLCDISLPLNTTFYNSQLSTTLGFLLLLFFPPPTQGVMSPLTFKVNIH